MARPRLFRLLDAASRRPVIWLEGPAGSGKTTAAASWVARRGGKCIWYQLAARDRDPATFFHDLREAVLTLPPRRREPLPLLTREYLAGLETYARNFFDGVFERLGSGAVLVLDDFQEVPEDAALHGILGAVLAAIPERAHVLVLSRAGPPPALARLRANSLLASLGWEALRFTPPEASGLLATHGIPRPGRRTLEALCAEVDGWAAGLVLLGERARRGDRLETGAGRPRVELFDYFASELFERASPATQRLLLATAPLSSVTAELADRLAGEGAGARLERLAREGFFTTRQGDGAAVYRYHPLFRAFLRARAEVALSPGERRALLGRAAELLDRAGQPEEALGLLQEAGDGAAAAALLVRLAPALAAQGRLQTLEAWIDALPGGVREATPWLLHWLGVCRLTVDPRGSLALHERAFAVFQARGDDAGSLAAWTGAMDALYVGGGDLAAAEPWVRWLAARIRQTPQLPTPELTAEVAERIAFRLLWNAPSDPELPAWIARLGAVAAELESAAARARALLPVVWYRNWTGDVAHDAALEELERACRAPGVPPEIRIEALAFCAMSETWAARDPERGLALATEALRLGKAKGLNATELRITSIAAMAMVSRRDARGAAPYLEVLGDHAGEDRVADCFGFQAASWHALLLGDPDRALDAAERALEAVDRVGPVVLRTQARYQLAQVHRVRGDAAAAAHHLAVAEETAAASRSAPFAWACRLTRAQLALDRGDRAAGRALLAGALAEGRERGFLSVPLSSTAFALAGLCEEALEAGIEADYVRRLIQHHDLAPDPARPGAERWPYAVRVTTLGPFAVHRADGRALPRNATRARPFELLKALVVLGGRDVAAARVVEMLWPGAEGDRGRQRLRFTLHALRRWLGRDTVRYEKGVLSLDPRRVWADAWELERQLERLAAAVERGRAEDARDALVRAVGLHRGALLEGDEEPWAAAARDRLEARVRRLVVRAVEIRGVDLLTPRVTLEHACDRAPGEVALQRALARAVARGVALSAS